MVVLSIQVQLIIKTYSLVINYQFDCQVQLSMAEQLTSSKRKFKIFHHQQQYEAGRPFPFTRRPPQRSDAVLNRANSLPSNSNSVKQGKTRLRIFDSSICQSAGHRSLTINTAKRQPIFQMDKPKQLICQHPNQASQISDQQLKNQYKMDENQPQKIKKQPVNIEQPERKLNFNLYYKAQLQKKLNVQKSKQLSSKITKIDGILKPEQFANMIQELRMGKTEKRKKESHQTLKLVIDSPFPLQKKLAKK